jgi:hypothetical protein
LGISQLFRDPVLDPVFHIDHDSGNDEPDEPTKLALLAVGHALEFRQDPLLDVGEVVITEEILIIGVFGDIGA